MPGRLLRALGLRSPERPSVTALRRLSDQLAKLGAEHRTAAARAALLRQRVELLTADLSAWRARVERLRKVRESELLDASLDVHDRVAERLGAARRELAIVERSEQSTRGLRDEYREQWARLDAEARALGHDTSALQPDLTIDVLAPVDLDLLEDEHAEYLARVVDGMRVH